MKDMENVGVGAALKAIVLSAGGSITIHPVDVVRSHGGYDLRIDTNPDGSITFRLVEKKTT